MHEPIRRLPIRTICDVSQGYRAALAEHLENGSLASIEPARGLASEALASGLQTLDLAKLHEQTLVEDLLPSYPLDRHAALIKQAGLFFAVAILPVVPAETVEELVATLSQRTVELAAANRELASEVIHRREVEEALRLSERNLAVSLEELRLLTRQLLDAQEEERRKISRELHDVISQTLAGIHFRLAGLKAESLRGSEALDDHLASTQTLVERSIGIVQTFARELRPSVLDDLGLIPALDEFMKSFTDRTGIRTRLSASADLERSDIARRTVLYRVVQEALANVARHAEAGWVIVSVEELPGLFQMTVQDDGKSFDAEGQMNRHGGWHLGLLGMRERVEMIGGTFGIESAPGKGTLLRARIPTGIDREENGSTTMEELR